MENPFPEINEHFLIRKCKYEIELLPFLNLLSLNQHFDFILFQNLVPCTIYLCNQEL